MRRSAKCAAAYLRDGAIFLHPDSRTTKGFWIACEPLLVTTESDKALGEQVLQTLSRSSENIPHPESLASSDSRGVMYELVKAAGVRSYEAFANSTKCVGIRLGETGVEFTPTLNGGYRRRFLYLKQKIRYQPVPEEVTRALISAFDACET